MTPFFTRQRFGRPQFLAGVLLLIFLAQAVWLVHSELHGAESSATDALSASEQVRIATGWRQIHGGGIAGAPFPDAPGSLPIDAVSYTHLPVTTLAFVLEYRKNVLIKGWSRDSLRLLLAGGGGGRCLPPRPD